jgi:hypothetical protein
MSQNARLKILRCVVVSKVFSKKRNFLARKNSIAMGAQKTIRFGFAAQIAQRHCCSGLPKPPSGLQLAADFLKRSCLSSLVLQKPFVMILWPGLPTAQLSLACLSNSLPS